MTKIYIAIILTLATACTSFASPKQVAIDKACKSLSGLAGTVMQLRQRGAEVSDVIDQVNTFDKSIRGIARAYILEAYKAQRFLTPEYAQQSIREFKTKAYIECEETFDK